MNKVDELKLRQFSSNFMTIQAQYFISCILLLRSKKLNKANLQILNTDIMIAANEKTTSLVAEKELRDFVFDDLISLPAYKLEGRSQQALKKYILYEDKKSSNSEFSNSSSTTSDGKDKSDKSLFEKYRDPNQAEIWFFSLNTFVNGQKSLTLILLVSFLFALLARSSNVSILLIGVISFLVFITSFLAFGFQFIMWHLNVANTFSLIKQTHKNARDYVITFRSIDKNSIFLKANLIVENIIEDRISSLSYDLWKRSFYNLVFAFSLCWLFISIFGNTFIEEIKWIATFLNFGDLKVVKSLDTETFVFLVLFPFGISLSDFLIVSSLQQRDKRLRQSLVIVKNRKEITSTSILTSQNYVKQKKQSKITKLFGTIEYENDYDYKKQRRNS